MPEALSPAECRSLAQNGFLALPDIVPPKQVACMRTKLERLLETTPQNHAGTLIVNGLLDDPEFDVAWNHPRVLEAVASVLQSDFLLMGVSSRGLRPGHGQQALHCDWGGQGQPGVWYICHAICALVDFTRQNGATRVVPGSHQSTWMLRGLKDPKGSHPQEVFLTGAAGTIFILNVHCLHSAVKNSSDHSRLALFSSFTRKDSPLLMEVPVSARRFAASNGKEIDVDAGSRPQSFTPAI